MAKSKFTGAAHSYFTTQFLRVVALIVSGGIITASVVSVFTVRYLEPLAAVGIIAGGVFVAILLSAGVLAFLNMSDDLKLLREEVTGLRKQLDDYQDNTLQFYGATNELMVSQLKTLRQIRDGQGGKAEAAEKAPAKAKEPPKAKEPERRPVRPMEAEDTGLWKTKWTVPQSRSVREVPAPQKEEEKTEEKAEEKTEE